MRFPLMISLIVLLCASVAPASETLREISWEKLQEAGQLPAGPVLARRQAGSGEVLKIENPGGVKRTVTVMELTAPGISAPHFAVTGTVRYEDVETESYLEMWCEFADGSRFFSRTLATAGPTRRIEGNSDWRPFSLPFSIEDDPRRPAKLAVNVVLCGRGTVFLGPLKLVQYANDESLSVASGAWWNNGAGGWIGAVAGSVLGCLGAIIGTLSWLGKARRVVLWLVVLTLFVGIAAVAVGTIALAVGQPYPVYYPLVLGGGIATVVMGVCLPSLRRRYRQIELRKMTALDMG